MSIQHSTRPIPESLRHPPIVSIPKRSRAGRRKSQFAINATADQIQFPEYKKTGYMTTTRLIRRAQSKDTDAINELWIRNARLCFTVANTISIRSELVADLIQESQESFPKAIRNFEIERLLEFSTYAHAAIRSHMLRALPKLRFSTNIPNHLYRPLTQYIRNLTNAQSRTQWFDAREDMINNGIYERTRDLYAIAHPEPADVARSSVCPLMSPPDILSKRSRSELVKASIQQLSERDQFVLIHRYGLWSYPEMTLQQIGDLIGVTRERVRQLQLLAEKKLREVLDESNSPETIQDED